MLEELFNLLNICNHGDNAVKEFIKIIHSIYDDLPDVQMISLPSITAGYKIIVFYYFCDSVIFHNLFIQPQGFWRQFQPWLISSKSLLSHSSLV